MVPVRAEVGGCTCEGARPWVPRKGRAVKILRGRPAIFDVSRVRTLDAREVARFEVPADFTFSQTVACETGVATYKCRAVFLRTSFPVSIRGLRAIFEVHKWNFFNIGMP